MFYCYAHLKTLDTGNNLIEIGSRAFAECDNLEIVNLSDSITTIRSYAFYQDTNIKEINIPKNLLVIEERAFFDLRSVDMEFNFENIQTIGDYAFYNMTSVTSSTLVIPDTCTHIGTWAFENSKVTTVYLGANIQSIGSAFGDVNNLTDVYIYAETPPVVDNPFRGCDRIERIHVPAGCLEDYKNEPSWSQYIDILVEQE
mgnify:FL=1